MQEFFSQKSGAREWRQIPWSARIGSATITQAIWAGSPTGLTFHSSNISGTNTNGLISGTTAGMYRVTCTVTTSSGETIPYTFGLLIE